MDFTALLQAAGTQGIWALLFVILFVWTIKRYEKREENYQCIIKDATSALTKLSDCYDTLKDKVDEIIQELK